MKTTRSLGLCLVCSLFWMPLSAQFDELSFETEGLNLRIIGGPSISYPMGKGLDPVRDQQKEFENQEVGPHSEAIARFLPYWGFQAGVELGYDLSDKFGLALGLRYVQRGYNSTFKIRYEDFEFQYDEEDGIATNIQWNTIDVPILAKFNLLSWLQVQGGVVFILTQGLTQETRVFETVWINGEEDDGYTSETTDSFDPDGLKNNPAGLQLGLELRLSKNIRFQVSATQTGKMFNQESVIQNLTLNSSIVYQFNDILN